jgi:hypothetical protein
MGKEGGYILFHIKVLYCRLHLGRAHGKITLGRVLWGNEA